MLTQLEADNLTEDFVVNLQASDYYQRHAILDYSIMLCYGDHWKFDWTKINNAIIDKWSRAGLERVKRTAWKEAGLL